MQLLALNSLQQAMPLEELSRAQVRELQFALGLLGYPVGEADGLVGPKTRSGLAEFKTDVMDGRPSMVGPVTVERLQHLTDLLAPSGHDDFSTREGTIAAIRRQCSVQGLVQREQVAYVLATTEWETAKTFQPVRESYWKDEAWRKRNFRYYPYYGRGYVQLTWKNNYEKYGQMLGLDLVGEPDLAMRPDVASFVLVHGFKTGAFTGRKISDYINGLQVDFVNARRCINGVDSAAEIARIANRFMASLD